MEVTLLFLKDFSLNTSLLFAFTVSVNMGVKSSRASRAPATIEAERSPDI